MEIHSSTLAELNSGRAERARERERVRSDIAMWARCNAVACLVNDNARSADRLVTKLVEYKRRVNEPSSIDLETIRES